MKFSKKLKQTIKNDMYLCGCTTGDRPDSSVGSGIWAISARYIPNASYCVHSQSVGGRKLIRVNFHGPRKFGEICMGQIHLVQISITL